MHGKYHGLSAPYRRSALVGLALAGTALSGWGQSTRAADNANAAAAEHAVMTCDVHLSVEDLGKIKAPKAKRPYHIEISVPSLANPYIVGVIYGATLAAHDAGVKVTVDAGAGFMDPASQVRQIENARSHKIDALLINPADPNGMVATIDDIVADGVPVFDVGTLSSSTKSYKVVQDDYTQGRIAADLFIKLLPDGGTGIVQGGPANATWARRRVAGFSDALKSDPKLKIASVTSEDINPAMGLQKFSDAAQAHPKLDWIYAVFNLLLPPTSIPPEYKSAPYIGGSYDPVMVKALKDGSAKAAIPDFPVSVGYVGITDAVLKLNGETVPMRSCIPSAAVTPENVNDPIWAKTNAIPDGWQVPSN